LRDDVTTKYGRKALRAECATVKASPPHERNNRLSLAATLVGQLVAGGEVSEHDAVSELTYAAHSVGLDACETADTVRKGLTRGARAPRSRKGSTMDELTARTEAALSTPEARATRLRNGLPADMTAADFAAGAAAYVAEQLARAHTAPVQVNAGARHDVAGGRCRPCWEAGTECFHEYEVGIASWA
jgi:hypothetical protein